MPLRRVWRKETPEEIVAESDDGYAAGPVAGSEQRGDVPVALPALTRAVKLGKRAATVGFDWPDVAGVRAKVDEELAELDVAAASGDRGDTAAEMGDLLFSVANWCRHLQLDPETCLRSANERFTRRFRATVPSASGDASPRLCANARPVVLVAWRGPDILRGMAGPPRAAGQT